MASGATGSAEPACVLLGGFALPSQALVLVLTAEEGIEGNPAKMGRTGVWLEYPGLASLPSVFRCLEGYKDKVDSQRR